LLLLLFKAHLKYIIMIPKMNFNDDSLPQNYLCSSNITFHQLLRNILSTIYSTLFSQ
jgi:hypothetical protein